MLAAPVASTFVVVGELLTGPGTTGLLDTGLGTEFALLTAEFCWELDVDVVHGTVNVTVVGVGPHTVQTVTLVVQPSATAVVVGAAGLKVVLQVVVMAVKPVGQISV